ncbi:unnamed protein product [Strongylus vulgaris]|uniref:Uncharacterized protein n=1 Tax=Strongylus vulgaris TaxID=40348 RepID=A0A3P7IKN5_STRVU|nr:unnamed protein product [Strongylus vulgaris]
MVEKIVKKNENKKKEKDPVKKILLNVQLQDEEKSKSEIIIAKTVASDPLAAIEGEAKRTKPKTPPPV